MGGERMDRELEHSEMMDRIEQVSRMVGRLAVYLVMFAASMLPMIAAWLVAGLWAMFAVYMLETAFVVAIAAGTMLNRQEDQR